MCIRDSFKGEFTRFSNPEDDMVIPMPGEPAGAMLGSKMNVIFSLLYQREEKGNHPIRNDSPKIVTLYSLLIFVQFCSNLF